MDTNAPWIKNYGDMPFYLDYPNGTIWDCFAASADTVPSFAALSYMGKDFSYSFVKNEVLKIARGFTTMGVKTDTRVAICLPNTPQAVMCLYALNRIGAAACMVHPLSAEKELTLLLKEADCEFAVILDGFARKFSDAEKSMPDIKFIVTHPAQYLGGVKRSVYTLFKGRKLKGGYPRRTTLWKDFITGGKDAVLPEEPSCRPEAPALVLFSGGTTGIPKAIALSNYNVNAMSTQINVVDQNHMKGNRTLAALPIFHGFGFGVCIHAPLINCGTSVLVPRVNAEEIARLLETVAVFAGVPSLFDSVMESGYRPKLSGLLGIYSGGDIMNVELKRRFNAFLEDCGCKSKVQEGYGATECFAASCLTPYFNYKEEGIGYPLPDTYYKICSPDTEDELPYGTDGEICLRGPSVMLGYLGHEEETTRTLRRHADGNIWLHTGDMGYMDEEGRVYFRQRIKRMIVTNGYNVYPARVEEIFEAHPKVRQCCVIGVPDPKKGQRIKAFVVTKEVTSKNELMEHCKKHIAKYSLPAEIEFIDKLPTTKLNKVDFKALEDGLY